jgi:ethanolamine ammonia-lyase large subunit
MRNQDLIAAARKIEVVSRFRNTIGLKGRLSVRLQPNHPSDDIAGIGASILDGLMYGTGDAVIGINPVTDSVDRALLLLERVDDLIRRFDIPTQSCVLAHVTTMLQVMARGGLVDLSFSRSRAARRRINPSGFRLHCLTRRTTPRVH